MAIAGSEIFQSRADSQLISFEQDRLHTELDQFASFVPFCRPLSTRVQVQAPETRAEKKIVTMVF